jgi:hypothetical protein
MNSKLVSNKVSDAGFFDVSVVEFSVFVVVKDLPSIWIYSNVGIDIGFVGIILSVESSVGVNNHRDNFDAVNISISN